MPITISVDQIVVHGDDQTVYITINDGDGGTLKFHADTPVLDAAGLLAYFNANKDRLHVNVLRKFWHNADIAPFMNGRRTELEAFIAWVKDGHRNIVGKAADGKPIYKVIDKRPWRDTHPAWIALHARIDGATTLAQLKPILKDAVRFAAKGA